MYKIELYKSITNYKLWLILIFSILIASVIIPVVYDQSYQDYNGTEKANIVESNIIFKKVIATYLVPIIIFAFLPIYIIFEVRSSFSNSRLNYYERNNLALSKNRIKNMIFLFLSHQISIIIYITLFIVGILIIDIGWIDNSVSKTNFVRTIFILMGFMIIYNLFLYAVLFSLYFIIVPKALPLVVSIFSIIFLITSLLSNTIILSNQSIPGIKRILHYSDGQYSEYNLNDKEINLLSFYSSSSIFNKYFKNNVVELEPKKELDLTQYEKFLIPFCSSQKVFLLKKVNLYGLCYQPFTKIAEEFNKDFNTGINKIVNNLLTSSNLSDEVVTKIYNIKNMKIEQLKTNLKVMLGNLYSINDKLVDKYFIEQITLDQHGITLPYWYPNEYHLALKQLIKNIFYADMITCFNEPNELNSDGFTNIESFYQYLNNGINSVVYQQKEIFGEFQWKNINQLSLSLAHDLQKVNYTAKAMEKFLIQYVNPSILIDQLKITEFPTQYVDNFQKIQTKIKISNIFNLTGHFSEFFNQITYSESEIRELTTKLLNNDTQRYFELIPRYNIRFYVFRNDYMPLATKSFLINANYYLLFYAFILLIIYGFLINRYNKYLILQGNCNSIDILLSEISIFSKIKQR